eukprot:CAMPEP_0118895500 /NCGR_PEP_ID=MMETSP1166-20130328/3826_1 /TAXON_ID=1104430 /ORGANISM="Chrysoreinhardia sp, Strain CCMP3193" /LENGTH=206 /DNA_ID=CAMNT_0006834543 /DNA_START=137 /DNA_END=757 /DNA_ORIENTATION=-
MAADDVSTWRGDIRRITREALSCTDATEEISKWSRIVKLWAAIVSETNDAADKEKLALAEKQLYHAHLARLELDADAQRSASENFISRYNRDRDAEIRAPQQPPAEQQRYPQIPLARLLTCFGIGEEDEDAQPRVISFIPPPSSSSSGDPDESQPRSSESTTTTTTTTTDDAPTDAAVHGSSNPHSPLTSDGGPGETSVITFDESN